ncbi:arabinosyltransferase C [Saccharopolyspora erythraea NRRL 2338]|uniref:Arabinosyl transferase n=2 Tax=Saccharopolyspora erythraea TaxID=1836 RepID=A4F676_SACEN|nr:arabinosyltransferase domain-containing protein [Saccharopolyspora erythraea]EQD88036.1 arabinosyltransferase [Saccharopolyspora erythraea D]PFG93351.1 arabinosyltransferase C [Saccharopolyspora erythraea NRRL 2338]QRK90189.1 arabinosyltransferase domain-containing protein [Saccharopolyspora erythraea]CAL99550.1 arabinosyl transferase [Saccharopolyspora erythraea NRRL 2338]
MFTGQDDDSRKDDDGTPSGSSARAASNGHDAPATRLKLFAAITGLLGTVLALALPFLPVNHEVTTLKWPTAQGTKPVSAPLVSFSPVWLNANVSCETARGLDARTDGRPGTLLSTNPPNSDYGNLTGLVLQVDNNMLTLLSKGQSLSTVPLPAGDCTISVHSDAGGTTANVGDQQLASTRGDQRPQLTGVYSDLDESVDNVRDLSFEARVDNRYESSATVLKLSAMALVVLAFIGSVVALRRLDVRAGRRPPRLVPPGWWKPTFRDVAVIGALCVWWVMGAMTSDDGYILTIARARETAGYVSNYFRWFAVPEAPFGWFYELYSLWVQISTATPWVRLPALLMGIVSWLLISREVLPRLGRQVRRSNAAGWAAAAVFLAFWLPYNNGLRPEPVVVLFSLLALCAVERAVATGRLMPAALGLVVAALAVGANPHGLVAVLPYIAALKPLLQIVRKRAREFGWVPVLAPIAASGFVILTVVFSDQTLQSVLDATDLRTDLGPSQDWYQELSRYNLLFSQTPDGSMTRRIPVLLVMLCLTTCAVVLLRRGKIRGAALGPSRRLLAVAALSFVVLALTPTKWTHHFGLFAAVGGALAALTALATSSTVLRSKRNRAAFFAGLMLVLAFGTTGPNAWWYVSGWGVPWFDKPPLILGYSASTVFLLIAAITMIVAFVEHLRLDPHNPEVVDEKARGMEGQSRALRLGTAPLSIICALLVVFELANFAKVIQKQWGSYSLGADNVKQITGSSCGLSDYVYVEANPQAGMLKVSANQPTTPAPPVSPDVPVPAKRLKDKESPEAYLKAKLEGFNRSGLPQGDGNDPDEPDWSPPHRFGGDNAPVWGSYDQTGTGIGELRTQWYDLPERAANGEVPVVVMLAGANGGANSAYIEFGRDTDQGFQVMQRHYVPVSPGPEWRDHRVTVRGDAEGATKMRVVATDQSLGPNGWVAVSAPRAPQLRNMTDFVGDAPTFVEWTAALVHPCLQIPGIRNGIAEMPKFRVSAGAEVRDIGQGWSSPDSGGPLGWLNITTSMRELPTYVKNDIHRDWGSLYRVDPFVPDALPAEAAMEVHPETHWGTWTPGPLSKTVQLPGDVPNSDDRNDVQGFGDSAEEPQPGQHP